MLIHKLKYKQIIKFEKVKLLFNKTIFIQEKR